MRLVLTIGGNVLSFTPINDDGPYPYLNGIDRMRVAARAGSASFGSKETPRGGASLDNLEGRIADLIGNPMRARADIYDDQDRIAFSGIVTSIKYGLNVTLKIEA